MFKEIENFENFLKVYFEKDINKVMNYFSEEIQILHTKNTYKIVTKEEMKQFLSKEFEKYKTKYNYKILDFQKMQVTEKVYSIYAGILLENNTSSYKIDMNLIWVKKEEEYKICIFNSLDFCFNNMEERLYILDEKDDIYARESLKCKISEFMDINIKGGLIGILEEPKDKVYFIDNKLLNFLGYTYKQFVEECEGKFINCIFKADRYLIDESRKQYIEEGEYCELIFRIVKRNKEVCWVSQKNKKIVLKENGKAVHISTVTDITSSKKVLDKLMTTDYDCIYYLDVLKDEYTMISVAEGINGVFRGVSRNYSSGIINFAKKYIVEQDLEKFIEDMKIENVCTNLDEAGEYIRYCGFKDEYGNILRKKFKASYVDEENKLIVLSRTDVTDMYEQEERKSNVLKEALFVAEKANKAKMEFLSRMSHDIRTPLNAIVGMSKIAQMKIDDKQSVKECLKNINSSSRYLLSLVNDCLDMSKIESGKMILNKSKFDFEELIKNVQTIICPRALNKRLDFAININSDFEKYYIGDALKVNQILMNLLSNAVKFTPPNGKVRLEVTEKSRAANSVQIEFRVIDTGIGMTKEFQKKMFEPFEQDGISVSRNNTGTGLGLAIVHSLVNLMNGNLKVYSELGKGTEFLVNLNFEFTEQAIAKFSKNEIKKKNIEVDKCFKGCNILLVEDNAINMEIAKTFLELEDFKVDYAVNGREAVNKFLLSEPNYYQAILMDIRMPEMDGLEATKTIRALERDDSKTMPIIALSANAFDSDIAQAKYAGMDDYLIKPLDPEKMYKVLHELIFGESCCK